MWENEYGHLRLLLRLYSRGAYLNTRNNWSIVFDIINQLEEERYNPITSREVVVLTYKNYLLKLKIKQLKEVLKRRPKIGYKSLSDEKLEEYFNLERN